MVWDYWSVVSGADKTPPKDPDAFKPQAIKRIPRKDVVENAHSKSQFSYDAYDAKDVAKDLMDRHVASAKRGLTAFPPCRLHGPVATQLRWRESGAEVLIEIYCPECERS